MLKHDMYIMSTDSLDRVNIFFYHPIKTLIIWSTRPRAADLQRRQSQGSGVVLWAFNTASILCDSYLHSLTTSHQLM